ncbi:hypothetical protein OS493_039097, partial [Desmophyllum pertusum]
MRKVIRPVDPVNTDASITTQHTKGRRYHKLQRLRRKRAHFRETHRSSPPEYLDPINLSTLNLDENQQKLLRKGPSFCPARKDINWQEVHDDIEAFEARLRTAVFFLEKEAAESNDNTEIQSHLPRVPRKKKWKPPTSKFPELELFLSNVRKDMLNPQNIRNVKDNLAK